MTACNCEGPTFIGAVNLGAYSSCYLPDGTTHPLRVQYTIFEDQKETKIFKGYACKQWNRGQKIESFFFGGTDTTEINYPLTVSSEECWKMIQTGVCGQNHMIKDGIVTKFEQVPSAQYQFLHTVTKVVLNCFLEEMTFVSVSKLSCLQCVWEAS